MKQAITGSDGSFEIGSFDPFCGQVRFSAEYRSAYWLRTGERAFYPEPNGTTPEIDLSKTMPADPVTIDLGARGGEVEIKVWDEGTHEYIQATLDVRRLTEDGTWAGAMSIATGKDGSSHTLFLPVATYAISLFEYPCGIKTYFAGERPQESFEIVPTVTISKTLVVNTFDLSAKSSYDNPAGQKCRPAEN